MAKTNFDEPRLAELWLEYKARPTASLKAYLVQTYSVIVKPIVLPFMRKKPAVIDFEDLMQAGMEGLLDAIEKFDPSKGNKFQTYASWRIKGAILDSITRLDWTPRSVREDIRATIRTIEKHYETAQTEPTVGAIAEAQGIGVDEVRIIIGQRDRTHMVHMEQEIMEVVAPTTDNEQDEKAVAIRVIMERVLTPEERAFVRLKFYEGYTNREIMSRMNLTPTNLKSLKDSATAKLMEHLRGYEYDD